MMMRIYGWSDIGQHHDNNDDYIFPHGDWPSPYAIPADTVARWGHLLAVADGVSTARLGAEASRQAVETIVHTFYDTPVNENRVDDALVDAALAANRTAWELTDATDGEHMAATTLVAAAIKEGVAWVVHAGDSRAYLVRPKEIVSLTSDHSVVQELVDTGEITLEEAVDHPESGVLTRALGVGGNVRLDLSAPITLDDGDSLVLCSDGLSTLVSDDEIGQAVRDSSPERAVHKLIDLANRRGGYDNISVVVASLGVEQPWWRRLRLNM